MQDQRERGHQRPVLRQVAQQHRMLVLGARPLLEVGPAAFVGAALMTAPREDENGIMMPTLWLEETAMVVYAFDVDETLEVSKGPVKLFDLVKLREQGHIVGLCGNWAMVTLHCPDWHHICSFVGPCGIEKHDFLRQLRQYIPGHDYVMVGNILGISGASDDRGAAERAGWRFIQESEFAKGVR
jgi:hypothetical protein